MGIRIDGGLDGGGKSSLEPTDQLFFAILQPFWPWRRGSARLVSRVNVVEDRRGIGTVDSQRLPDSLPGSSLFRFAEPLGPFQGVKKSAHTVGAFSLISLHLPLMVPQFSIVFQHLSGHCRSVPFTLEITRAVSKFVD